MVPVQGPTKEKRTRYKDSRSWTLRLDTYLAHPYCTCTMVPRYCNINLAAPQASVHVYSVTRMRTHVFARLIMYPSAPVHTYAGYVPE